MNSPTLQNLIDAALSLVDETSTSPVGQYDDGAGTIVQSTSDTLTKYAQDGADLLARTCLYREAVGTATTQASVGAYAFTDFVDANGYTVWYPCELAVNGQSLLETDYAGIRFAGGDVLTDTGAATATYWYKASNQAVRIYPMPATAGLSMSALGPSVPPISTVLTATIDWCAPDETLAMTYYMAWQIALRNKPENTILGMKAEALESQFCSYVMRIADRTAAMAPAEYNRFYAGAVKVIAQRMGAISADAAQVGGQAAG